jgi:phosphatidate cytidylyltransferase
MLIISSTFLDVSTFVAAVAFCLVGAMVLALFEPGSTGLADSWPVRLAAVYYAALPLSLLLVMRWWPGPGVSLAVTGLPTVDVSRGMILVLMTLSFTWATDTGAYVVGRLIGRRLFMPRLSPSKTWEGTIGGVAAGTVLGGMWSQPLHWSIYGGLALGFVASWAAVLGDLAESSLKRRAGVKDSGSFLPGHGGLLDRIDSLAFSTVVVFLVGTLGESTRLVGFGSP